MKKLAFALLLIVLPMAGCSCDNEVDQAAVNSFAASANINLPPQPAKVVDSSTASCGDFPRSEDDGSVQSRYAVCKNASTGDCYIKTLYPRPNQGCDPEFGKFRTGNPKCFTYLSDIHEMGGDKIEQSQTAYRTEDKCELTTPEFFAAVMKARK